MLTLLHMPVILWTISGILIVIAVAVFLIRMACIERRSLMRKAEMRRHIEMIMDPNGCESADAHLRECMHIHEHYGISFKDVGFWGGTLELWRQTIRSVERAGNRNRSAKAELSWRSARSTV